MSSPEYTPAELAMARCIAEERPELAGRIYDGAIGMHDLAAFRNYAERFEVEKPHGVTAAMRAVVAERRIILHWDECYIDLPTPETLDTIFHDNQILINPVGTRGMGYWLGPGDATASSRPMESKVLRVDLDPATGSGAARWEGNLVAVEPGYSETPFGVWGEGRFEAVPHDVARVSYTTARRIAVEYVKYGIRPQWISWVDVHPVELDDDFARIARQKNQEGMHHGSYGTSGGVELTDEVIERAADEAELGYEINCWNCRNPPRPSKDQEE